MKRYLLTAAASLALCGHAHAWVANATSQGPAPNSASAASADTGAAASASAVGGNAVARGGQGGYGYGGAGGVGGAGGAGGNLSVNTSRSAPPANAPTLSPAAQCGGVSSSGGLGSGLFSFAFGRGEMDRACQVATYLRDPLTFAWACREWGGIRQAAKDIGHPCPQDAQQPVQQAKAADYVDDDVPDWCFTSSPGERKQHRECVYKGAAR